MPTIQPSASRNASVSPAIYAASPVFLDKASTRGTSDRLQAETRGNPPFIVTGRFENVIAEAGTDAQAIAAARGTGEIGNRASLGGVSAHGARLDQGAAAGAGERAVAGVGTVAPAYTVTDVATITEDLRDDIGVMFCAADSHRADARVWVRLEIAALRAARARRIAA